MPASLPSTRTVALISCATPRHDHWTRPLGTLSFAPAPHGRPAVLSAASVGSTAADRLSGPMHPTTRQAVMTMSRTRTVGGRDGTILRDVAAGELPLSARNGEPDA